MSAIMMVHTYCSGTVHTGGLTGRVVDAARVNRTVCGHISRIHDSVHPTLLGFTPHASRLTPSVASILYCAWRATTGLVLYFETASAPCQLPTLGCRIALQRSNHTC